MNKQLLVLVLPVFIVVGIILGYITYNTYNHVAKKDFSNFNGTLLSSPRPVSNFELNGIDGKPFNKNSLNGHFTFMFFGFTYCKYTCPTIMSELQSMYKILEEKKASPLPQVVMVSLDPERDTLANLNKYVKSFNPQFYGALEDLGNIKSLTQELGIAYTTVNKNSKDYDIEHTGTIMLFNPEGQLIAFFTAFQNGYKMAEDYMLLTS